MRRGGSIGSWVIRAATVLLVVSSTIRYFGKSAGIDRVGTGVLVAAVVVGLVGIALDVVARVRRRQRARRAAGALPEAQIRDRSAST